MKIIRSKRWLFLSILLMIGCVGLGAFWYNHNSQVSRQKKIDFKSHVLQSNKPLTSKMGELVWPWNSKYEIDEVGAKKQIDICAELGFKYVKIPLYMNYMVSENGELKNNDFGDLLSYIRKKGMTPIVRLWFTGTGGYQSKKFLRNGKRMAKTIIDKYADDEIVWESSNEPNQIVNWFSQDTSTNLDWAKFEDYVGKTLKSKNKYAIYIEGDLSGTTDESAGFLENVISHGYFKYADALSNHPYQLQNNAFNGQPENGLNNNRASKYLTILAKYNRQKLPLVTSEVGYSTEKTWAGQWDERDQANYIARQIFVLDMQHQPLIVLLALSDAQTSEGDKGWGLMKGTDYSKQVYKPSGVLVRNLLSQMKGYTYRRRLSTQKGTESSFALLYTKSSKKKIVYWSTESQQVLICRVEGQQYTLNAIETPQVAIVK